LTSKRRKKRTSRIIHHFPGIPERHSAVVATLLAVGFAVLLSMMLAPHGGKRGIEGWALFFSAKGVSCDIERNLVRLRWQGHDRHAGVGNRVSRHAVSDKRRWFSF
jgi:hypothetical protein